MCEPKRGGGVSLPRVAGVVTGVLVGAAVVRWAPAVTGLAPALVALEGVAALALIALVVRNLVPRRAMRPAPVQCEVRAIAAPPLAIEPGLLQGQTDPAMREMLRGVAAGLRDRYGTLEPDEERMRA